MPSLLDHIEHLATAAKAIHTSAASVSPTEDNPLAQSGPFTRAVLDTALGDLIRDIDASELGLFTLVPTPDADVRKQFGNGARRGEISRVGFPGATPLRNQPARRDEMTRPKELEPEVYARAALKYLDRYQSIRPMPRARSQVVALLEQLDQVRNNIKQLNETLHELTSSAPAERSAPQTSGVAEQESRINDVQCRLAELRMQKEALLRANEPQSRGQSASSAAFSKPHQHQPTPPAAHATDPDTHEHAFWSTPGTPARTLRFTEKLMDEEVDFSEVSAIPFDSPGPPAPRSVFAKLAAGRSLGAGDSGNAAEHTGEGDGSPDEPDEPGFRGMETEETECADQEPEDADDEEGERTVVLRKVPLPSSPPGDPPPSAVEGRATSEPATKVHVRVTPELERIAAKLWSTVGEVIMPGNPYSGGVKPPRAKETLALIRSLAAQSPSLSSPSSSSVSSFPTTTSVSTASGGAPTPHQINTAQLLHALLTAPNHAMQLNKLKAVIGGTRALYACVAKKLIRIDRGGGEQVVLFDV